MSRDGERPNIRLDNTSLFAPQHPRGTRRVRLGEESHVVPERVADAFERWQHVGEANEATYVDLMRTRAAFREALQTLHERQPDLPGIREELDRMAAEDAQRGF